MIITSNFIDRCKRYINSIGTRVENEDWFDFIDTAVKKLKMSRTLPWQKKEKDIDFYTNVFKYSLPSDFESFIKPTTPLLSGSEVFTRDYYWWWNGLWNGGQQVNNLPYGKEIDFFRNFRIKFALTNDLGVNYLLARVDGQGDLRLDGFSESVDEYTLGGDASNKVSDDINFREGRSSLRFDIADSTNESTIERTKSDGDVVDINDYINLGKVFLLVYMPTVVPGIVINYGSDSSNFYTISTVTKQFNGADFQEGWNTVAWDMKDAIATGSPENDKIKYYKIEIDNTGVTDVNFRVDGLFFKLATNYRLPYNSNENYKDSNGNAKTELNNTTDIIIWDKLYENVLLFETVKMATGIKFRDVELFEIMGVEFQTSLDEFNRRFPSNESPVSSDYYRRSRTF